MIMNFSKIWNITELIYNLIILNLLWLLTTMLGGFIFGIVPSTFCLINQLKRLINKEKVSIYTYFNDYIKSFLSTNKMHITLIGFLIIWSLQFFFFHQYINVIYFISTGILLLLLIIYATKIVKTSIKNNFKSVMIAFIKNPKFNIYMLLLGLLFSYITINIEGFWLFFSFSSYIYCTLIIEKHIGINS